MASTGAAPEPSDEAIAQRVAERRWVPVIVVTGLILLLAGGGRTLAAVGAGETRAPLDVGAVEIQPPLGWDVVVTVATPPFARLQRGSVVLDVFAGAPEPAGPLALAERYVDERLRLGLRRLAVANPAATTLANGVPAVRFGYVGVTADGRAVEGVVVAATGARASALFDASAPQGELATAADDVRTMIAGAVVG
jgi:hypothetical protein